jgi:hypothetical protein
MAKPAGRLVDINSRPPPRNLTAEERQALAANWGDAVCESCGYAHAGVCPRVRRTEVVVGPGQQRTMRVWYWPEGKWSLPPDAISPSDVFGPGMAPAPIEAVAALKPGKRKSRA